MSQLSTPEVRSLKDLVRGAQRLSRRVRTLIVAGLLFVVLFVFVFTLPIPYVVLSPGPTYNTLGSDGQGNSIIKISGKKVNKTSGHLNMTTVGVSTNSITPFEALTGWLAGDEVVVPKSSVYPPGKSQKETDKENTRDFVQSQDSAEAAALCELHYPVVAVNVLQVASDGPARNALVPGERIMTVDGRSANSDRSLRAVLESIDPGTKVDVGVTRNGKSRTVAVTLGPAPKGEQGGRLGIGINNVCKAPFTIDLGLANQIGGPSAGLMFALGIIDKVGRVDLTKGRFIAGTGTIDPNGNVGAIGGIQLKMIAAKRKGASVFLAPADNCKDVRNATPDGLKVVKVATLHDAVQDLERIEKGQHVPAC